MRMNGCQLGAENFAAFREIFSRKAATITVALLITVTLNFGCQSNIITLCC